MDTKYCQCCGMPMGANDKLYGTEVNGDKSQDYCKYCYDQGKFTCDCTMEEMIEFCITPMTESNPNMSAEQARAMMQKVFPSLKRWKVN